jgi:hypothetical protein
MTILKRAAASLALLAVLTSSTLAGVMDVPYEPPPCDEQQTICSTAQSAPSQDTPTDTTTVTVQIITAVVSTILGF